MNNFSFRGLKERNFRQNYRLDNFKREWFERDREEETFWNIKVDIGLKTENESLGEK